MKEEYGDELGLFGRVSMPNYVDTSLLESSDGQKLSENKRLD